MSLRRSLYKHYSRNSASASFVSFGEQGSGEKHWIRDWYDPPKISKDTNMLPKVNNMMTPRASGLGTPIESTPQSSTTPQSQTPQPVETYGFKVKTWILSDEPQNKKDCINEEKDTMLPLESNQYQVGEARSTVVTGGDSGLTEAEMKSAVGGPGISNTLFSSSSAQAYKEKKDKEQKDDGHSKDTSAQAGTEDVKKESESTQPSEKPKKSEQ